MARPVPLLASLMLLTTSLPASAAGPPLETDPDLLERAVRCPIAFSGAHEPVLLVHGTAGRPEDHWALGYQKILPELGFDVCTVRLPDFALGDIQIAAEYVVHAVRSIATASGKPVDIVGYSQGGLEPRWALKYWQDVRASVDDLVTLASTHHGALSADGACAGGSCQAGIWQQNQGSMFLAALNEGGETLPGIDTTSIYSLNDDIVQPQAPTSTSALAGATNLLIQDVCAARDVSHGAMPIDAVAFALVLDALTHPGTASSARLDPDVCDAEYLPGLTPDDALVFLEVVYGNGGEATAAEGTRVDAEPPLKPYALPEAAGLAGLAASLVLLRRLRARRQNA